MHIFQILHQRPIFAAFLCGMWLLGSITSSNKLRRRDGVPITDGTFFLQVVSAVLVACLTYFVAFFTSFKERASITAAALAAVTLLVALVYFSTNKPGKRRRSVIWVHAWSYTGFICLIPLVFRLMTEVLACGWVMGGILLMSVGLWETRKPDKPTYLSVLEILSGASFIVGEATGQLALYWFIGLAIYGVYFYCGVEKEGW